MRPLSIVREFSARPAVRALAANLGWLAADKGLRLLLGLTVGTWVARHLGPADFGALNFAVALASLLAVLPALGLDGLVRRELVHTDAPTPALLGTVATLRLGAGLLAYLALATATVVFATDTILRSTLLFSALLLFQPALLTPDLWFQAHQRSKHTVIAQNIAFLLSSLGRVALILTHAPVPAFAALIIVDLALFGVLLARTTTHLGCPPTTWRWEAPLARRLLFRAWPLLLSSLSAVIYLKIDQVMVKLISGPEAAGHYAAATKISEICYLGPVILASALFPAIVRARTGEPALYIRRIRQYFNLSALVAYAVVAPLALASPWIIHWLYGPTYAPAAPLLALHVCSLVFVAQGVARQEWLLGEGLLRFSLVTTTAGAALNIALNAWLIPRHGALGAAAATVVSLAFSDVLASLLWSRTRAAGFWQLRALLGAWKLPPARA